MANNRLYLLDTEKNEYIMLAKGFAAGWELRVSHDDLTTFVEDMRDFAASSHGPSKLRICTEHDLPADATHWATPSRHA